MASMTFLVNGAATGHTKSAAWVTIKEIESGRLSFKVVQSGDTMGNLHGVFFDVDDECIISTLRVTTVSNDICVGDNSLNNKENVIMASGLACEGNDYDVGLEIEESAVRKNKIRSYSFTLSSTKRGLSISDFSNIQLDYSGAYSGADTQCNYDHSYRWLYMGLS